MDAAAASPLSQGDDGKRWIAATLLVAISRKGTRCPPRGKPGVPKVGRGHSARATSATLQTTTREDRHFFLAPGDAGGRDQEIRLKCVVSSFLRDRKSTRLNSSH